MKRPLPVEATRIDQSGHEDTKGFNMVIALEKQKAKFRDAAAFEEFLQVFREALKDDAMPLVVSGNELLFAAISRESAQQLLADRISKRLAENPEMLSELRSRLESDDIVD
jgi:hypothetical protein